jgi:hypothetical protein
MESFIKVKEWLHLENDHLHMYDTDIRGIYSDQDIKKDDIILAIPQKYIIEYSEVKCKKIKDLLNRNSHLILYLYSEMNKKKSFFQPFFDSLPQNMNNFVDFYSKKELNQLKYTSLACQNEYSYMEKTEDMKKDSKIMYTYLVENKKLNSKHKKYDDFYKEYVRLKNIVDSRIFSYEKNKKEAMSIVPYADLFNHGLHENTYWYFNDEQNQFEMMATEDIPKNTQIYDSYGDKSNLKLLFFYGFTIPNNPFSVVCIDRPESYKTYEFTIDSKIVKNKDYKYVLEKLQQIYNHHTKHSITIKNNDILNIYKDEMNIIKKMLKIKDVKQKKESVKTEMEG